MTGGILEAVPNFSEGRDLAVIESILDAVRSTGAEILDWSADPDHHRAVVTFIGPAAIVERAALAAARVAIDRIDLRKHRGVHPRVGALDVLPFVPLAGATMEDARASARRVGRAIATELGLPVYFYGAASDPRGRRLAELRRGGFETIVAGWPDGREPDLLPAAWPHRGAHPTAGATCVGARPVLLAWNVFVDGITRDDAREIVAGIRESGGGFQGLRALALELPGRGALQISMNLEDLRATAPIDVLERIEASVRRKGGRVLDTEVIGMMPDALLLSAAAARLRLKRPDPERMLSRRLAEYLAANLANDGSER